MTIEVQWRRKRADELRAMARQDAVVILPVGSIEQHGPHLPVEVDSLLVETVALRAAARMAEAACPVLVLPTQWAGISEHHMGFGGTVTLSLSTFLAVIGDICRAVQRHGFRRIVLLNGHGGNDTALRAAVDDLTPALGLNLVTMTYWHAAAAEIAGILTAQTALLHACEAETAMTMALRPELVDAARIPPASNQETDVTGPGIHRWRAIASRSATGVIGTPRAASAAQGEELLDVIAAGLASRLADPEFWQVPWEDVMFED